MYAARLQRAASTISSDDLDSTPRRGDDLIAQIGGTPLIDLRDVLGEAVPDGVRVVAKCEWFNPGGSVKDRPAASIILDAERRGRLVPGGTIVDASSGNTGIAYAMIAAARGYRLVLCLPKNANAERRALLNAYGATVVETDPLEGSDGAIRKARQLAAENPDWIYLDQYGNPANWQAHFRTTGPEIVEQTDGTVTHFVSCLGTSGTFTGVGRYLRANLPEVTLVEVQPDSPFHGLEGLKHMESAIQPAIWSPSLPDIRLGAPTEASYALVRECARNGLLIGPSGGAALWASLQVARRIDRGVIATVLPDGGQRYLSDPHIWEVPR